MEAYAPTYPTPYAGWAVSNEETYFLTLERKIRHGATETQVYDEVLRALLTEALGTEDVDQAHWTLGQMQASGLVHTMLVPMATVIAHNARRYAGAPHNTGDAKAQGVLFIRIAQGMARDVDSYIFHVIDEPEYDFLAHVAEVTEAD